MLMRLLCVLWLPQFHWCVLNRWTKTKHVTSLSQIWLGLKTRILEGYFCRLIKHQLLGHKPPSPLPKKIQCLRNQCLVQLLSRLPLYCKNPNQCLNHALYDINVFCCASYGYMQPQMKMYMLKTHNVTNIACYYKQRVHCSPLPHSHYE